MKVVDSFEFRRVSYELRYVNCGKLLCSKCPHGPYWYARVPMPAGRMITRYIGRHLKGPAAVHYTNINQLQEAPDESN